MPLCGQNCGYGNGNGKNKVGRAGVKLLGNSIVSLASLGTSVDVASMGSASLLRERSVDGSELVSVSLVSVEGGNNCSSGTV